MPFKDHEEHFATQPAPVRNVLERILKEVDGTEFEGGLAVLAQRRTRDRGYAVILTRPPNQKRLHPALERGKPQQAQELGIHTKFQNLFQRGEFLVWKRRF
jgi:hypothetical protein